jgi:hypothetical protein
VADPARYIFHVEAQAAQDAFLRVLAPFAVAQAVLTAAELTLKDEALAIRIEAIGLDGRGADRLARRLRGLAAVTSVGLGWRGA